MYHSRFINEWEGHRRVPGRFDDDELDHNDFHGKRGERRLRSRRKSGYLRKRAERRGSREIALH